ncbi:hypothetical protein PPERSA_05148 [Pseudocohnilembus persalinus]|uniref:Uncharacterized protein n=1 Tax=Pseudocohnilembus persalinus TaxID=266149 RepID=A0A0V0QWA6_PSEPJ|nr:hypothetical protein PPERSA_05148 [Pseudocohnilembus persalinus]|eukprot:KRX06535.1 hypothetical protein PPERSA_05148 [Pseudocohnilembus persalinus]
MFLSKLDKCVDPTQIKMNVEQNKFQYIHLNLKNQELDNYRIIFQPKIWVKKGVQLVIQNDTASLIQSFQVNCSFYENNLIVNFFLTKQEVQNLQFYQNYEERIRVFKNLAVIYKKEIAFNNNNQDEELVLNKFYAPNQFIIGRILIIIKDKLYLFGGYNLQDLQAVQQCHKIELNQNQIQPQQIYQIKDLYFNMEQN